MKNDLLALIERREATFRYERDLIMMMSSNPHEKAGPTREANLLPNIVELDRLIAELSDKD